MQNITHYSEAVKKNRGGHSLYSAEHFQHIEENIREAWEVVQADIWRESKWCESFTDTFARESKNCQVFTDIGADVGFYIALAAKYMPAGGMIYAFEPDPVKFVLLNKFYHSHNNIKIFDFAVGDSKEILEFTKPKNQSATAAEVEGEKISVKAITLDEFFTQKKIDILKIDIEGGEAAAFKGMQNILQSHKPRIFLELHYWVDQITSGGKAAMEKILAENNYEISNFDKGSEVKTRKLEGVRFYISPAKVTVKPVRRPSSKPPFKLDELILNYTSLCNGRCTYCTIWKNKEVVELDAQDFENIFRAKQLQGLNSCYVTGGEPYISDNVMEIAKVMHKHLPSSMLTGATNGILMKKTLERALKIKKMGIRIQLQVSLNGTKKTHDYTRGLPGSWDKAVTLIDKLLENDIETCPTFSMMPQTVMDLPFMRLFCKMRGLPLEIAWVRQSSRYDEVDSAYTAWPKSVIPRLKTVENLPDFFDCPALKRRLTINPDGSVYPCEVFREELYLGNIKEQSLEDILNDERAHEVDELIRLRKCHWCQGPGEFEGNPKWMVMDCYRRQSPQAKAVINPQQHALYADYRTALNLIRAMSEPFVNLRLDSIEDEALQAGIEANLGRKEFRLIPLEKANA